MATPCPRTCPASSGERLALIFVRVILFFVFLFRSNTSSRLFYCPPPNPILATAPKVSAPPARAAAAAKAPVAKGKFPSHGFEGGAEVDVRMNYWLALHSP